jgi:hypothetical protein
VSFLTTRVKEPDEDNWGKLKRILRYLNGTRYLKLTLAVDKMQFAVHWYVDGLHQIHQQHHTRTDFDPELVGRSLEHSIKALGLGLGATETEVKVKYCALARIYHPDKHDLQRTGMSQEAAADYFKLINNAQAYLCEVL